MLNKLLKNQKIRFVLVGGFNTVVDFAIMNIGRLFLPLVVANTLSTGTAMLISYFLNGRYTFKSNSKNRLREIVLFFVFTIIGIWVIQNGFIWLIETFVPHFGPNWLFANIAKIFASVPSLIWNFVTYRKFVFCEKSEKDSAKNDVLSDGI